MSYPSDRLFEEVAYLALYLHVDPVMRRALGGVADDDRAAVVPPRREPVDRVDRPERVGDDARGYDAKSRVADELIEAV